MGPVYRVGLFHTWLTQLLAEARNRSIRKPGFSFIFDTHQWWPWLLYQLRAAVDHLPAQHQNGVAFVVRKWRDGNLRAVLTVLCGTLVLPAQTYLGQRFLLVLERAISGYFDRVAE